MTGVPFDTSSKKEDENDKEKHQKGKMAQGTKTGNVSVYSIRCYKL